ncbi:MAG: VanZ family protein [Motiliproteus sp.]
MRYQHRNLFRLLLVVSLIAVTFLATTGQAIPVLDSVWDKAKHFFAFLVLAGLSDFSFPERRFNFFNLLLLVVYGLLIEVVQWYLPYRYFSLLDVLADALGGFFYLFMAKALLPIKSRLCAG